jgi:hypothetical protein
MDVDNNDIILKSKNVIISYCSYLLGLQDHRSLATDMKELLYALPEDIRVEIQGTEFKGEPKSAPDPEGWEDWE